MLIADLLRWPKSKYYLNAFHQDWGYNGLPRIMGRSAQFRQFHSFEEKYISEIRKFSISRVDMT